MAVAIEGQNGTLEGQRVCQTTLEGHVIVG